MSLAQNLRKYRNIRKLSQSELAQAAGVSAKTVSNIEQGTHKHEPNFDTIRRLAMALEIEVEVLTKDPAARSPTSRWLAGLREFVSGLPDVLRHEIVSFARSLEKPPAADESTT